MSAQKFCINLSLTRLVHQIINTAETIFENNLARFVKMEMKVISHGMRHFTECEHCDQMLE